ncbi:MAG: hypothetical protein QY328_00490 [Anaerolineales bacterium]|nr:MAG: hypothetical protein QY328_00490 [Anaerolineales bacterium]
MTKVNIFIDPTSPIHKELEKEILGYVASLESVKYQTVTTPSEPGKLGGVDHETIKIIVDLSTAAINFITAIMLIASQVSASKQKAKEADIKKSIQVEVEGVKISLPVSASTAKKYIKTIKIKIEESASDRTTKNQPAKKSRKK